MNDKNFLKHYGILGMHWGRKKGTNTTTIVRTNASEDHNKQVTLRGKKLHELTNDELRAFTQRSALEKQFKELTKEKVSPGRKFVTDFVTAQAKQALTQYASAYNKKMVETLLKKTMKDLS